MSSIEVFEKYAQKYDEWFGANRFAYESEVLALRKLVPTSNNGLEVGVGTGRFAVPLGIKVAVEPAKVMADIAQKRGIQVCEARAEKLPFKDCSFDLVLMVTILCFVQDHIQALNEVRRVLRLGGHNIIGMIDRGSFLGKLYESKKKESNFYRHTNFHPVRQVLGWLEKLGFEHIKTCQTIFKNPKIITTIEPVKEGYGEGGFVVIAARRR